MAFTKLISIQSKTRNSVFCLAAIAFCVQVFVVNLAYGWEVKRNFNDGTLGFIAVGSDGFSNDAGKSYYTSEQSKEGGQAVELNITEGKTAFGSWGGIINFPSVLRKGQEIWASLELYIPSSFDMTTNTGVLKFLRLRQRRSDGSHTGYLDNVMVSPLANKGVLALYKEGQNILFPYGELGVDDLPRDKWFRFELYAYLDETSTYDGGSAIVRTWVDDKLLTENTRLITLSDAGTFVPSLYLFTYWNGGAPKTQSLFVDNIIITNEMPANRDSFGNPRIGNTIVPEPSAWLLFVTTAFCLPRRWLPRCRR